MTLSSGQRTSLRTVALLLCFLAACTLAPLWTPLVLASWLAHLLRPVLQKITRAFGGRHGAAAMLTTLLVLAFLAPLAFLTLAFAEDAMMLLRQMAKSRGGREALQSIVVGGGGSSWSWRSLHPNQIFDWVKQYGANAWDLMQTVAGAAANVLLWLFLFLMSFYCFLLDGPTMLDWVKRRSPLAPSHVDRLVSAYHETGRGLLVGVGLTAFAQGITATLTYWALGVPRVLPLGLLTSLAALIPSVGTALVWVPVAAALAFTGRVSAALALCVVGVAVIGSIDNVLRPFLSRFGELRLSGYVLLLAMFGGLALFGAWGLALGPLLVRLAAEALSIASDENAWSSGTSE